MSANRHKAQPELVVHELKPVFSPTSRVLVLGTMPSPASREARFYYGHPQNRFWRVLARLFDEPLPETNEQRARLVLDHGIALWDVPSSCEIAGASDASIANAQPQNLKPLLDRTQIACVFTTGATASKYYKRFQQPLYPHLPHRSLPSTSPANARMSLDDLVRAYQPLRDALEGMEHGGATFQY